METTSPGDVTQLLIDWRNGDKEAFNKLMPLVYDELRHIAKQNFLKYGLDGPFQPTALVNEAYIKLVGKAEVQWQNRAHFYAIAANTIRQILADDHRKRIAGKRGGSKARRISLSEVEASSSAQSVDFMALNEALEKLKELDESQTKIIELRFFGGLTNEEIAEVLGISLATVERKWRSAKAWLYSQLLQVTN